MDWASLTSLSPGLAAAALAIYFSNGLSLRYLEERKEMIENIIAERKAWEASHLRLLDRYDARAEDLVRNIAIQTSTIHTLKSVITALQLRLDAWMAKDKLGGGHD